MSLKDLIVDTKSFRVSRKLREQFPKYVTEWLWYLDEGESYQFYEKNQFSKFVKAGRGTRVEPSLLGLLQLRETLSGKIDGFGRDKRTIRVVRDGRKSPESYWVGFWRLKT